MLDHRSDVGIVGLGRIGAAIAERLTQTHTVFGWDVIEGARLAISDIEHKEPPSMLEHCKVLLLCLPSPNETSVVLQESSFLNQLKAQHIIIDMSTSEARYSRRFAHLLSETQASFLDAPILGRPDSCGNWTLPVGGNEAAFETAKPILERLASRVIHVGEIGSANTIKLLNNLMFAAINSVTAEVIAACDYLDVSPDLFFEVVGGSAAATVSPLFLNLVPRMLGKTDDSVFSVDLMRKDVKLAVATCEEGNVPLLLARTLQSITDLAHAQGLGSLDSAALIKLYENKQGQAQS